MTAVNIWLYCLLFVQAKYINTRFSVDIYRLIKSYSYSRAGPKL
jgi:hypothetical protein